MIVSGNAVLLVMFAMLIVTGFMVCRHDYRHYSVSMWRLRQSVCDRWELRSCDQRPTTHNTTTHQTHQAQKHHTTPTPNETPTHLTTHIATHKTRPCDTHCLWNNHM